MKAYSLLISPSLGLIVITLAIISVSFIILRKKTNYNWSISVILGIVFFLSFNDYVTKRQAELIISDVFDYKQKNDIAPKSLKDIYDNYFMRHTSTFGNYNYEWRNETDESYQWKLEFTTIWGTEYYYDDKTGDLETKENWQGSNHWNEFRKTKE